MSSFVRLFMIAAAAIMCLAARPSRALAQEATTVGGYGELHYNEPDGSARGKLDFHRFVVYIGHSFTDRMSFKSEVEIEHTKIEATDNNGTEGGEVAIEQAYLDWHLCESMGIKAGIILPPLGIINQYHEPPTFNGVERPRVETFIIPSTWREAGAGIYGTPAEGVNYQLYMVAGLDAEGFSAEEGFRGGRQEALESSVNNPSLTGRIGYVPMPDLQVGGSFFVGNTTGTPDTIGSGTLSLLSADLRYAYRNFSLRAVGASGHLGDAEAINAAYHNDAPVDIYGISVEAAIDVMPYLAAETDKSLALFTRYEKFDTQAKIAVAVPPPSYDEDARNEITIGATFAPVPGTALKIDYQFLNNAAGNNTRQLNLGIGYSF